SKWQGSLRPSALRRASRWKTCPWGLRWRFKAWLDAFEDGGNALAAANAHGDQRIAAAGAVQLMDGLDGDDRAGRANRVAQRDARTIGVDLGRVGAQALGHCAGLRGKGFIGFDDIHLVE